MADADNDIGDDFTIDAIYTLPSAFGGIACTHLTFETTTGYPPIAVTSEGRIRDLKQTTGYQQTGRPQYAAFRPRTVSEGTTDQSFEMLLWPAPNATFKINYTYNVLIGALDSTNTTPIGSMFHSETILAACMAVAQQRHHPKHHKTDYEAYFYERLKASIAYDRQSMASDTLGYNADRSDGRAYRYRRHASEQSTTYTP